MRKIININIDLSDEDLATIINNEQQFENLSREEVYGLFLSLKETISNLNLTLSCFIENDKTNSSIVLINNDTIVKNSGLILKDQYIKI